MNEMCFYERGERHIVDTATAAGLGSCTGDNLQQVQARYPVAELMPLDEACRLAQEAQRAHYCHGPVEITAERFEEMLNVLPPMQWKRGPGAQSFKMSELTCGTLTGIFCEVRGRYFELCDDVRNSHEWIVRECRKVIEAGKGGNWAAEMAEAYSVGLADGKGGGKRRGRPNDFEACYEQGWQAGKKQRLDLQSENERIGRDGMRARLAEIAEEATA